MKYRLLGACVAAACCAAPAFAQGLTRVELLGLQQQLRDDGCGVTHVTGRMDGMTRAAVKKCQSKYSGATDARSMLGAMHIGFENGNADPTMAQARSGGSMSAGGSMGSMNSSSMNSGTSTRMRRGARRRMGTGSDSAMSGRGSMNATGTMNGTMTDSMRMRRGMNGSMSDSTRMRRGMNGMQMRDSAGRMRRGRMRDSTHMRDPAHMRDTSGATKPIPQF
ncbi:MAG: hypothetical protein M3R65_05425 [Gemmatimonadota bacterium]|nr:hypothetical protein [Gemmatimonadota bacterium]